MSFLRRNDDRIENKIKTTKPELIRLNSTLSADNERLRNCISDLRDKIIKLEREAGENTEALARLAVQPIVDKIKNTQVREFNDYQTLNARAKALATQMRIQTRVRNNEVEVFMHGGWNAMSTIAVPTHLAG